MRTHPAMVATACRLVWRPSRWTIVALVAMGIGAAFAILVSGIPEEVRAPLALCALLWSGSCAWREHRRPARVLEVRPKGMSTLDNIAFQQCNVHWRGPLAFLRACDTGGCVHRLAFWPDILDARGRRALRLASQGPTKPPLAANTREMRG
jgi:toxin CptA